jgi:hypothetical protein
MMQVGQASPKGRKGPQQTQTLAVTAGESRARGSASIRRAFEPGTKAGFCEHTQRTRALPLDDTDHSMAT